MKEWLNDAWSDFRKHGPLTTFMFMCVVTLSFSMYNLWNTTNARLNVVETKLIECHSSRAEDFKEVIENNTNVMQQLITIHEIQTKQKK